MLHDFKTFLIHSRSNSSTSFYSGPIRSTHTSGSSPLVSNLSHSETFGSRPAKPTGLSNAWLTSVSSTGATQGSSTTDGPEPSSLTKTPALTVLFCMHPLLSYRLLRHAPISYDIAFTPSARTVVDRIKRAPVPAITLAQPATEPPIPASSHLLLRSPKLPWVVIVKRSLTPNNIFIGKRPQPRKTTTSVTLTNLDVLYAVHGTLMNRVTPEEWASLGEGSRAQRRVAQAYKERCTRMGGGWEKGVVRLDWLGPKTHFMGVRVEKNKETGVYAGRLVFGKG